MKKTNIDYYNWFDLQEELCKIIGIEEKHFRRYHEVIGGDYKDFWHVCLDTIVPSEMHNGNIVKMYSVYELPYYKEEKDEWKNIVLDAWNKLYEKLDDSDMGIWVYFYW